MKKQLIICLLVIALGLFIKTEPYLLWADTIVSGNITHDTLWTSLNGPYIVSDTLQVFDGITLTIEAGTRVIVMENKSIRVAGSLVTNGLGNSPVVFTTTHKGVFWNGIELSNSSSSRFTGTIFEYAHNAINLNGSSAPNFTNNIFRNNGAAITDTQGYAPMNFLYNTFQNNFSAFSGIRTNGCSYFIYNNFLGNREVFSYGYYFGSTKVNFNNFVNNGFVIKAPSEGYGYGTVDISQNWWGTTDTSIIDDLIFDKYDDVTLQVLNYMPIQADVIEGIGSSIKPVPLLSTMWLLFSGVIVLIGLRRFISKHSVSQ